jgi:hypothetical protein
MRCIVPSCRNDAVNELGVRLRKPSTRAVYAPNCAAFLCKDHAEAGGTWSIDYTPRTDGRVETLVASGGGAVKRRITPIQKSAA